MNATEATAAARQRLERAARDLVYISESDAPFTWVHFADGGAESLSPAGVALLAGAPMDQVEERPLERFFAGHIERADPHDPVAQANVGRYLALRETLHKELGGVRAFRVGRVNLRCLLIGRLPDGTLGGLETQALET
jgi:hypothetical protein